MLGRSTQGSHTVSLLALSCVFLLSCSSANCEKGHAQHDASSSGDLFEWLKTHGATAHLSVGSVNSEGLRGTLATKDFQEGETIAMIPNELTIDIAPFSFPGAELAVALLRKQLSDPKWNASFEPYWRSLPEKGTLYSKENWRTEPEHLQLLQDEQMASYAEVNGNWTRAIFDGTADVDPERMFPDLLQKKVPGAEAITFEDFRHAACLYATYSFVFASSSGDYMRVLLPLLDLVNHKGAGSNAYVGKDPETGAYHLTATRSIRKGEEVSHTYNWGNERNDYSLINYFFIQKSQPPRMCALDLPNGSLEGGFGEHDDHYLPHEKGAIQRILEELEIRLKSFPTTEEEDEKILSNKKSKLDWIDRKIIEYRKERKRALRYTVARLRERAKTAYSLLGTESYKSYAYKDEL